MRSLYCPKNVDSMVQFDKAQKASKVETVEFHAHGIKEECPEGLAWNDRDPENCWSSMVA